MMRNTAAKRKAEPVPTLAERIEALREEIDEELTRLSEEKRPWNVPGPCVRQGWMARGGGSVFEAYLAAIKEFPQ